MKPPKLEDLDLSVRVESEEVYDARRKELQLELLHMQTALRDDPRFPVVMVFEGMDAAGKGGAIRRLTGRLDPRGTRVHAIGPPDAVEARHHYLWRFWQRMPARGGIAVFDRSWYGRVLVERVEKLCPKEAWKRAYEEIVAFEGALAAGGAVLAKFWLHVSKKEQLRRFRERQRDPFKEYKITPEDWRNRRKWDAYVKAAGAMFRKTHTKAAPWTLVSGEDKRHARLAVLETVVRGLRAALRRS